MYKGCSDTILREVHLLEHNLKNIAVYDFWFWPVMMEKIHTYQE